MQTLEAQEERQLLDAVKEAVDLAEARGISPTAAITKVATDMKFGPGKIKLVCAAYNTGRQTSQRESRQNVLDKLAEFPLADPAAVIAAVYGEPTAREKEAAAAVDAAYSRPPSWLDASQRVKTAEAVIPVQRASPYAADPIAAMHKTAGVVQRAKQAADEASRVLGKANDDLLYRIADLTAYFRKQASQRLPFATVESAAGQYFGKLPVQLLMDTVYQRAKMSAFREKRASDADSSRVLASPLNMRTEPFSVIHACIKAAQVVNAAKQEFAIQTQRAVAAKEAALRPFSAAGTPRNEDLRPWNTKAADIFGGPAIAGMTGAMLQRGLGAAPGQQDGAVEDAWMDLEDPEHQNELRKIRTQTMLTSMLTDADDPISGHDPDAVLRAYNELSQMAPRTADQPGALRPLLRRRLSGHTEPFEAKELTDIEKGIVSTKNSTPNTSLLSDVPDKLLG